MVRIKRAIGKGIVCTYLRTHYKSINRMFAVHDDNGNDDHDDAVMKPAIEMQVKVVVVVTTEPSHESKRFHDNAITAIRRKGPWRQVKKPRGTKYVREEVTGMSRFPVAQG